MATEGPVEWVVRYDFRLGDGSSQPVTIESKDEPDALKRYKQIVDDKNEHVTNVRALRREYTVIQPS